MARINKKQKKILNVIRSKLPDYYSFIRVLSTGRKKMVKVTAASYEMALEKALFKFKHIIHHKQTMDLITAINRAKKASADTNKMYYVIVDLEDGECSVNTAPIGNATHKFVNGEEDKSFTERHKATQPEQKENTKPKKSIGNVAEATVKEVNKLITTKTKEKMSTTKKSTPSKKEVTPAKKSEEVKKIPAKKGKQTPAKKESPTKKVVEKGAKDWGKKVTMTNKEMSAKIKKGFIYRNSEGQNKTKYIPLRPNQELVNEDYYELAPSK